MTVEERIAWFKNQHKSSNNANECGFNGNTDDLKNEFNLKKI